MSNELADILQHIDVHDQGSRRRQNLVGPSSSTSQRGRSSNDSEQSVTTGSSASSGQIPARPRRPSLSRSRPNGRRDSTDMHIRPPQIFPGSSSREKFADDICMTTYMQEWAPQPPSISPLDPTHMDTHLASPTPTLPPVCGPIGGAPRSIAPPITPPSPGRKLSVSEEERIAVRKLMLERLRRRTYQAHRSHPSSEGESAPVPSDPGYRQRRSSRASYLSSKVVDDRSDEEPLLVAPIRGGDPHITTRQREDGENMRSESETLFSAPAVFDKENYRDAEAGVRPVLFADIAKYAHAKPIPFPILAQLEMQKDIVHVTTPSASSTPSSNASGISAIQIEDSRSLSDAYVPTAEMRGERLCPRQIFDDRRFARYLSTPSPPAVSPPSSISESDDSRASLRCESPTPEHFSAGSTLQTAGERVHKWLKFPQPKSANLMLVDSTLSPIDFPEAQGETDDDWSSSSTACSSASSAASQVEYCNLSKAQRERFIQQVRYYHYNVVTAMRKFAIYKRHIQLLVAACEGYVNTCLEQMVVWRAPRQSHMAIRQIPFVPNSAVQAESILQWFKEFLGWIQSETGSGRVQALAKAEEISESLHGFYVSCPDAVGKHHFDQIELINIQSTSLFIFAETLDCLRDVVLSPDTYKRLISLVGRDAESLVEVLNKLLDYNLIEVSDKLRRQCLDALRKLCGRNRILPKSFVLPVDTVRQTSDEPVAYGGFADVYQGQFGGSEVALKVLRIHKDATNNIVQEEMATFCREAVVWKRLRHPNITPFIGIDETSFPSRIAIVCKWMPYGTVAAYLSRHRAANRPKLSLDVARGLEYLHGMNILHGDLKSANILVDEQEMACLADFGLAALFHTSKAATFSTVAGSTRWVAPELFDPEQFGLEKAENTPRSDVYALSMVIWEIFTGRIPFDQHKRDATVMLHVLRGARPQRPAEATPLGLSDDVWALMEGCWDAKWQNRPPLAMTVKRLEEVAKQFSGGTAPIEWPLPL